MNQEIPPTYVNDDQLIKCLLSSYTILGNIIDLQKKRHGMVNLLPPADQMNGFCGFPDFLPSGAGNLGS